MSQFKKSNEDFEKARQSHLSAQRDFVNKMQTVQGVEEYQK